MKNTENSIRNLVFETIAQGRHMRAHCDAFEARNG